MATIDDKVVALSFESSKFEQGVNKAISSLDKLKASLKFEQLGKGLETIQNAMSRFNLGPVSRAVDEVSHKFDALRLVAIGVLSQLATSAVRAGGALVKSLTLDPIKMGYQEYQTNLNSIQTILANTQAAGTKLKDVTAALDELNEYSDKTIYNFSQMARNIGTFTAAGVALEPATAAIKGIANLAALSGSNADQASTAMYQLSQALSAGRVTLMDWNSVVNAGMGGTVFQRALAQTAEAMGTLEKGAVKLTGPMKNVTVHGESFRNALAVKPGEKSWLTSEVLTNTLAQFTSDLSDAELAAMGFNEQQIKAIQQTAKTAMFAATEVKTLTQVLDVAKETAQSGWAKTWQIIFGDFGEAKTTFTALSNAINGFINANADARNKVLADWKALGGRTVAIDAIKTAFKNLSEVIKPIKEAFRDVFPAITGKNLYDLTLRFKEFADALKPSEQTVENLKRTFRGLFALLDIGKQVIGGILGLFGRMFGAISDGSGGFLEVTGSIGDYIYNLDQALKKSGAIEKIFSSIGDALAVPVKLIKAFASAVGELFGLFSSGGSSGIDNFSSSMSGLEKVLNNIEELFDKLIDKVSEFGGILGPIIKAYGEALQLIPEMINQAISNMNFEAILSVIRTGLFAGLVVMLKGFFGKGSFVEQLTGGFKGLSGGIIQNIAGSFQALQGSMVAMQNNIKAKTLKEIAIAVALLAVSVLALSMVDPKKLNTALAGIAILMGELVGAMMLLDKIGGSGAALRLPVMAAGLIALAIAIDLLTLAVLGLSRLSWSELLKGLGGVVVLLGGLAAASGPLSANAPGMIRAGVGLTAIAIAMNLLALAVRQLGTMNLGELAKGLGSIGVSLGIMIAATNKMNPAGMIKMGAGLAILAVSLNLIALAVRQLGTMSMSELAKGLGAVAVSLGLMVAAVAIISKIKNLQVAALGLIGLGIALNLVAQAVKSMSEMSWGELAKGLAGLGGALVILAAGLYAMSGSLAGAAALVVAAAGITLLVKAVSILGGMSIGSIVKGLVALAAVLGVVAAAAMLLGAAAAPTLAFSVALLAIGAAVALVGAGIFLISTGIAALAVALPSALGIMGQAIAEFQRALIDNAKLLALGVLEVAKAFADAAPKFVDALVKIMSALIDGIIKMMPKIQELFNEIIITILAVLSQNQDKIIQAGFDLLIALLQGIKNNLPLIVTMVADIIILLLRSLASNLGRIVTAGYQLLISFLKGIYDNIGRVVTAVVDIITRFVGTIAANLGRIITAGVSIITSFLTGIARNVGQVITAGANAIINFVTGLGRNAGRVVDAGVDAVLTFIRGLGKNAVQLAEGAAKVIVQFLNGLTAAINTYAPQIRSASMGLGFAIIDGITWGLASKAEGLYNKAREVVENVLGIMKKVGGIFSPSKETMKIGKYIMDGLYLGISGNGRASVAAAEEMSRLVIGKFAETFQTYSPSKVMMEIGKYVGQGFAEGLRGSVSDINDVWKELNDKLLTAMQDAREIITSEKAKLKELQSADKQDAEAIKAAQKTIKENQQILLQSKAAHDALTSGLKSQKAELIAIANEYDKVSTRLEAAQDKLKTLKQERDALAASTFEQYTTLPEIDQEAGGDQLAKFTQDLQNQITAVGQYKATLDELRKLGLDESIYEKLLTEGTADQAFANQLLAGGKTAIEGLNKLDAQLETVSKSLATTSAGYLKKAGIDAAQGLINGLRSKKDELEAEAREMAEIINRAFRAALKSKSPSRVFMEIGQDVMEGFIIGIADSAKSVKDAMTGAADNAVDAMKSTIGKISAAVSSEMDINPVITPVLDLTQVRDQVGALAALTNVTPITAAASYGQASMISAEQMAQQMEEMAAAGSGSIVKFEQNNYSPKALTEIEIYRQTKNQLSQVKSMLAVT